MLRNRLKTTVVVLATIPLFGGCAVVNVAAATAGAAISITGAVVSTGARITGKVIEKTIDAVSSAPDVTPGP